MESREYQKQAERTLVKLPTILLDDMHMILGMQTEVAELSDAYKKHIAYGKELDLVNVKEELGDAIWYIANMCNLHGWSLEDIMETNIKKLQSRYPEKFTNEKALNRDLVKERGILENSNSLYESPDWTTNVVSAGVGGFSENNVTTSADEDL